MPPRDLHEMTCTLTRVDLVALAERGNAADRAFVDGMIRMRQAPASLRETLIASAARSHAGLRDRIGHGFRGAELRQHFDAIGDDHVIEEILGIAYPPLDEPAPVVERVPYLPSSYAEIMHAFDVTGLGVNDAFLDIGSGAGKTVLLASLLTGARSRGIECDAAVHAMAASAASTLNVDARFEHADALSADFGDASVVFMYIPFTGRSLEVVIDRVVSQHRRFLCASALDRARFPMLSAVSERSWMRVYAWSGGTASVTVSPENATSK
jgi:predicted RNA methylase